MKNLNKTTQGVNYTELIAATEGLATANNGLMAYYKQTCPSNAAKKNIELSDEEKALLAATEELQTVNNGLLAHYKKQSKTQTEIEYQPE